MKISIFGASGIVGSCTAFVLADRGLADEIVMLGTRQNIITSHAMDIQAAMTGRKHIVLRSGSYADISGSDIVIIAAGVHFPAKTPVAEKLEPNIPIIKNISNNIENYCPGAVVITASNPVDFLNYAVYLSTSLDRHKLIGFSLNDSTRFRMVLADALGISSARVEGLVMGEHPGCSLPIFSCVKIDGQPYTPSEDLKQKVREGLNNYLHSLESLKAGRSAGWTTASGLAAVVRAIVEDTGELLACSAVLEGEYGYEGMSFGIPAVIGQGGISQILELELTDAELSELDTIARSVKANSELVRRLMGSDRP
jgi:malate/lactate dehydrogenase